MALGGRGHDVTLLVLGKGPGALTVLPEPSKPHFLGAAAVAWSPEALTNDWNSVQTLSHRT